MERRRLCKPCPSVKTNKSWKFALVTYLLTTAKGFGIWYFKHEYLRSRAYICLSLSSPFSSSSVIVSQICPLSRYSCCYLGSLHPRNFFNLGTCVCCDYMLDLLYNTSKKSIACVTHSSCTKIVNYNFSVFWFQFFLFTLSFGASSMSFIEWSFSCLSLVNG